MCNNLIYGKYVDVTNMSIYDRYFYMCLILEIASTIVLVMIFATINIYCSIDLSDCSLSISHSVITVASV